MKHIVYALSEPAEQIKWEDVRYIGISKNVYQRFGEHLSCREDANPAKNAWVKSLLGQGQMPLLFKIEEVETTNEALTREHYWIRFAMTQGAKLFNLSITPTDEERVELLELQRRRTMQLEMRRRRTIYLSTSDLPDYKLGTDGELNPFDATDTEFLNFVQTLVPLNGENLDHWTWEERRDFLNWCLDEHVLTVQDGRLVPYEESTPTVPLSHDSEEIGFLDDVERARPVIQANPAISAQALADALGLKSAVSAQTLKVSVNAHKSTEKGTA